VASTSRIKHPALDAVFERQVVNGRSKANALDDTANYNESIDRDFLLLVLFSCSPQKVLLQKL
jgi:hypothetical protein